MWFRKTVWQLATSTSPLTRVANHRLNPTLLDSITAALHRIQSETTSAPSALITTAHGRFFSNGYDLAWGQSDPDRNILMSKKLRLLIETLISFPMLQIRCCFILAQAHDYVMMRKDRGYLYMSEMDIKLVVPDWFVKLLKCKIGNPSVLRDVVLSVIGGRSKWSGWRGVGDAGGMGWHVYAFNRNLINVLFADVLPALDFDETVEDVVKANVVSSRL
ncbi:enoyl-CoA delta isomerase 1, peroxisomal-like protein [Tanacetum coccineum]